MSEQKALLLSGAIVLGIVTIASAVTCAWLHDFRPGLDGFQCLTFLLAFVSAIGAVACAAATFDAK